MEKVSTIPRPASKFLTRGQLIAHLSYWGFSASHTRKLIDTEVIEHRCLKGCAWRKYDWAAIEQKLQLERIDHGNGSEI